MTALETLADLGFRDSEIVATRKDNITVKVRTAKGWTYEKFVNGDAEASVRAWAKSHEAA